MTIDAQKKKKCNTLLLMTIDAQKKKTKDSKKSQQRSYENP
jgi:hypothetical protein